MWIEQVFIAMLVDNFLYPISALRSHFSQSINWSGIRYHLRNGKISKVCSFLIMPFFFLSSSTHHFFQYSPLLFSSPSLLSSLQLPLLCFGKYFMCWDRVSCNEISKIDWNGTKNWKSPNILEVTVVFLVNQHFLNNLHYS